MEAMRFSRRAFLTAAALQPPKRPNILLLLADNWAYPHASAYGDAVVKTPVFDRLARDGVVFTRAFAPVPSCSPSRSSLLTGQPAHRLEWFRLATASADWLWSLGGLCRP